MHTALTEWGTRGGRSILSTCEGTDITKNIETVKKKQPVYIMHGLIQ